METGKREILGHDGIIVAFSCVDGFFPPRGAQAPFTSRLEPDATQVVAARGGEVEEFARQDSCNANRTRSLVSTFHSECIFGRPPVFWMVIRGMKWGREDGGDAVPATA